MNICLKTQARQVSSQTVVIQIQERKPERVNLPCELTCVFQVATGSDHYLLTMEVSGKLEITCQRCLAGFQQEYFNKTQLAICASEEIAERLMASYECIVVKNNQVDLVDLITDELHLFLPEKHADFSECDNEISGMIGDNL